VELGSAIAELEKRYGVSCDEFRAWLAPHRCDLIPAWEIHRWIALLEVLDKGEQ
jgi:hypothetical protein